MQDVCPQKEREEWHFPEHVHKGAYRPSSKEDQSVLDDVVNPANTSVASVCAAGKTSQIAADILYTKGYSARWRR